MSTFTTQVRYICESKSGFTLEELENKTIDEVIEASRNAIFNFDFPVYDEAFRGVVESSILLHFYTREIGAETVGLWQHYMCRKLREKMPYYNKLFESALLEFNPLYDVDYTRTHEGDSTGNKNGNTTRNAQGSSARTMNGSRRGNTSENIVGGENTSNNGTLSEVTDTTNTTENEDNRTDTTNTESYKTGSRNGSKTTHDTHSKSNDHKDYYSDTPMTKVEGVNGMDSGSATLGSNYYLTNYRRIKDDEEGENNGTETQTETTSETDSVEGTNTSHGTSEGSATGHGTKAVETTDTGSKNTTQSMMGEQTETTTDTDNTATSNAEMGTSEESYTNTDDYIEHIVGKMGTASYSSMLTEYRATIINYMEMLLNDLEPLFMNIW